MGYWYLFWTSVDACPELPRINIHVLNAAKNEFVMLSCGLSGYDANADSARLGFDPPLRY